MKYRLLTSMMIILAMPMMVLAQQTVYVKPATATIRGGSGFGGPKVEDVKQNTPLIVLENSNLVLKVRTPGGKEGFIPKSQIQDSPVGKSSGGGLGGFVTDDREISQMKTASVNRGLTSENQELVNSGQISEKAKQDLDQSTSLSNNISEQDVEFFLKEGNLG